MQTLYEVFGVEPSASENDIRKAYYALCKQLHPDKTGESMHSQELESVQRAYEILSDNAKRTLYDIKNNIYSGDDKNAKLLVLHRLRREKSETLLQNMQMEYSEKKSHEEKVRGIIIKKALYGNLRLRREYASNPPNSVKEYHLEGPWVDVTIPLQCQIDKSRFIFSGGGGASLEFLDGFYNPSPLMDTVDLSLYALYSFKGELHEVTSSDSSFIAFPLKAHRLSGHVPKGPMDPNSIFEAYSFSDHTSKYSISYFVATRPFYFLSVVGILGYCSYVCLRNSAAIAKLWHSIFRSVGIWR